MASKHGFEKGLNVLIPLDNESPLLPRLGEEPVGEVGEVAVTGEIVLPLEKLRTSPYQPRSYFDQGSLQELADSIREHGIIQPIIAEDVGNGTYIIVAGERRSRAAGLAGLKEVPVIIRSYTDEKRMEVSLIENIQRTDLNPIEEALAYKRLMEWSGLSQDEVAAKVGKKRSTVANTLRLLKLPPAMQECLKTGKLSSGHARALLAAPDAARQEGLFQKILSAGISVREAEKIVGACNHGEDAKAYPQTKMPHKAKTRSASKGDPALKDMEDKLIESLGTKVTIKGDLQEGSIHIDYYSMEDLDRLYELLGQ